MKNLTPIVFALLAIAAAPATHAQGVKWHPGHYLKMNSGAAQAEDFRHIDEISREPAIKGVQVRIWWYELERSKNVYDFSKIDAYLRKLKSLPTAKRLVVRIMDRKFQTTSRTGIIPNYLMSDPIYKGGLVIQRTNSPGYVARLWEAPVMDRLIALYAALGSRYDGESYLEGFITEETTLSLGDKRGWPAGYSQEALLKQYLRFVASVRQTMPHTNLFIGTNFLGNDAQMGTLLQSMFEASLGASGPNVMPTHITQAQRVWTGLTGADYRGAMAIGPSIEPNELGGSHGDNTPKQIYDFAYKTLQVNYLFWPYNTWIGSPAQKWSTGILPFLRTNPPVRTTCPLAYGLCNQ